jgi:hypothetical protein
MSEPAAAPDLPELLPPPDEGGRPVLCGRWWDAVTVDAFDGVRALAHLGDECGPFIEDRAAATMTWLVAPDCAAGWELRGVRVRGLGHWLTLPPTMWEGSPRWRRVPPEQQGWLTRPTALHAALGAVLPAGREAQRGK